MLRPHGVIFRLIKYGIVQGTSVVTTYGIRGLQYVSYKNVVYWLPWSMGSVLAFSTQVCGFKPGRSRRVLGRKNLQHAFLRRGSKAVGPMS